MKFVTPEVYLVGATTPNFAAITEYLKNSGQEEFLEDIDKALRGGGVSGGEILCSMFAKMCYKSLVVGKNSNVTKVRDIKSNLMNCHDTGHGSVFEHSSLNFIIQNCSRVFTHELVRHRVGTAFSQTSGRYTRLDNIEFVLDPILEPVRNEFQNMLDAMERLVYIAECKLGLRKPPPKDSMPDEPATWELISQDWMWGFQEERFRWIPDESKDFETRKKLTSAIRRIAPNGQSNEIALTINIRALRHLIQLRTSRFSEWEIRYVFNQIYKIVKQRFPMMFYRAKTKEYDGLLEVYGMKATPYEIDPNSPNALEQFETIQLQEEIANRSKVESLPL